MPDHAISFVRWNTYRSGAGERYSKGYLYACKRPRLKTAVETGDTLWLVTSRRTPEGDLRYSLAYKLVDCAHADPSQEKQEQFGRYMVVARDWDRSVHFAYNDATDTLRRLRCTTGRPLWEETNLGNRLTVSMPRLTPEDVTILEAFEQRIRTGRIVFLSYSRQDEGRAARLEAELEARNVRVYRDVRSLHPGEPWETALERAVRSCSSFLVLASPNAAASHWVRQEVAWALDEQREGGLVSHLVPILLPEGGWASFDELEHLHRMDHPAQPDATFYDRLAAEVQRQPRPRGQRR